MSIPQHPRDDPPPGPRVCTDIVDVYVFAREDSGAAPVRLLQLRRSRAPYAGTWHPVMGHVEPGESAADAALRELAEEIGLSHDSGALLGLWQLEQVHPYFVASLDAIVLSPRFAALVPWSWTPELDDEHDAWRWVGPDRVPESFLWPGQRASVAELLEFMPPAGPPCQSEPHRRVPLR